MTEIVRYEVSPHGRVIKLVHAPEVKNPCQRCCVRHGCNEDLFHYYYMDNKLPLYCGPNDSNYWKEVEADE